MQKIARRLRTPITLKISQFCINKVSSSVKVVQKIFITPQVGLGVLILVFIAAVIVIPMWQVKALSVPLEKRLELEDKARATLTQIIGGISIGLYFALRNIRATERNVKVAEEKASTERFSRAIDMLGDKGNIHARLGGIHALEQLAKYVPEYAVIVLNVLSSFVREEARLDHFQSTDGHSFPSRPPIDIQEAIRAIGRRNTKRDPERIPLIDLEYTNLSGLVIYSLDGDLTFKLASFRQANLQNSQILGVDLRRADMSNTDLRYANLFGTNLQAG